MKSIFTSIVLGSTLLGSTLLAQAPASKSAASKSATSKSATTKTGTPAARPSLLNPASLHAKAPEVYKAQFTTTRGDFVVEVHRASAPLGADRFYNLVKNGYFTNAVNKVWMNANIKDDAVMGSNKRGTLVFATAGPNTRTTQLFINFGDNAGLDRQGFAPFGTVTDGMDVVDKIYPGYGERPDQQRITEEGKAYLDKNFPMLDSIKAARILPATPPAAPADKK
jgi:peptidyl-prolyl cis-trans isomerase A (cyclophilin A)